MDFSFVRIISYGQNVYVALKRSIWNVNARFRSIFFLFFVNQVTIEFHGWRMLHYTFRTTARLLWEIKKKGQIDTYIYCAHLYIYRDSFSSQKRVILVTQLILHSSLRYFALSFRGPVGFFPQHRVPRETSRFCARNRCRVRVTLFPQTFLTPEISNVNVKLAFALLSCEM